MLLVIGNKRYSSWSLRPWLLMKHFEIPFEEKLIALDQPQTTQEILKYSASGRVPALVDGDLTIWDSLAIAEYLNEKYPQKKMWPEDRKERALARSIANEMHSGFQNLRNFLPHDLKKELKDFDASPAAEDIRRIKEIWTERLRASGGPFLFGRFTIADAMYAPVVNRFLSYGVPIENEIRPYVDAIRLLAAHAQWIDEAKRETLEMPRYQK